VNVYVAALTFEGQQQIWIHVFNIYVKSENKKVKSLNHTISRSKLNSFTANKSRSVINTMDDDWGE
jgi:hypothetical protein